MFSQSSFLNDHHLKRFLRIVTANGSYISAISFLQFTKYCGKSHDLPTKMEASSGCETLTMQKLCACVVRVKWLWVISNCYLFILLSGIPMFNISGSISVCVCACVRACVHASVRVCTYLCVQYFVWEVTPWKVLSSSPSVCGRVWPCLLTCHNGFTTLSLWVSQSSKLTNTFTCWISQHLLSLMQSPWAASDVLYLYTCIWLPLFQL